MKKWALLEHSEDPKGVRVISVHNSDNEARIARYNAMMCGAPEGPRGLLSGLAIALETKGAQARDLYGIPTRPFSQPAGGSFYFPDTWAAFETAPLA